MERRTRKDIERRAAGLGLGVDTYSPGDGMTRYRFREGDGSYFEGNHLGTEFARTALGAAGADTWLDGYQCALRGLTV